MKFPAYGNAFWQRRLLGDRPRVVCLMVGDRWKLPKWLPVDVPKLAVKTEPWHQPSATRYDWRLVGLKPQRHAMTVLAVDVRGPDEREETSDGWDPWLWLLADVQRYARDVLLFTPMIAFHDPPGRFAPERWLETYAWLTRSPTADGWQWPPWWPYGDSMLEQAA